MNRLNITTLSLGEGRTPGLLPEMAGQAGDVDLLLVQAGKGWHQDGQRSAGRQGSAHPSPSRAAAPARP